MLQAGERPGLPRLAGRRTGPHLHKRGLEAGVVTVWRGAAVLLVGQVDACGTVQLLQLAVAALLPDHPVGRGAARLRTGPWEGGVPPGGPRGLPTAAPQGWELCPPGCLPFPTCSHSQTHTRSHVHTHALARTHSPTHTCLHTHSFSRTRSLAHTHLYSHSQSHSCTHAVTCAYTHTHPLAHLPIPTQSHVLTRTLAHPHTRTHTHLQSHTRTHAVTCACTHTHAHTPTPPTHSLIHSLARTRTVTCACTPTHSLAHPHTHSHMRTRTRAGRQQVLQKYTIRKTERRALCGGGDRRPRCPARARSHLSER